MDQQPLGNVSQIMEVAGFLPTDECQRIAKAMSACTNWVPDQDPTSSHQNYILTFSEGLASNIFDDLNQWFTKATSLVSEFYGDDFLVRWPGARKWHPGEELGMHADAAYADGKYTFGDPWPRTKGNLIPWPAVDISVLLYFNSNYDGGLLNFPMLGKCIKPQDGLLVAFPSTRYFFHEVTKVTNGYRYSAFSFFSRVNAMACLLNGSAPKNWTKHFINSHLLDELMLEKISK